MAALIVAHRGGAPSLGENSAAAFEHGIRSGADMLEMDVRRSADGHLIVRHDKLVTLTDGIDRPVSVLPLHDLQRTLPDLLTFEQFLECFAGRLPMNIDIKITGYEREIVRALRRHDFLDGVLISSTHSQTLRAIKLLAPEVKIGLSRGQVVPWLGREPHSTIAATLLRATLPAQLPIHGGFALADRFMLNYRLIQPWLVRYLHARGFGVFCWTVNDLETARWLNDAGVDGIATDHPERLVGQI